MTKLEADQKEVIEAFETMQKFCDTHTCDDSCALHDWCGSANSDGSPCDWVLHPDDDDDDDDAISWPHKHDVNTKGQDSVAHPEHYTEGRYECIDVMRDVFGDEAVKDFAMLNAFKYIWRADHKNGVEDLEKAVFYLNWIIEHGKAKRLGA